MNLDDQVELEHLLFTERKCRVCGQTKNLIDGYYLIHSSFFSDGHQIYLFYE